MSRKSIQWCEVSNKKKSRKLKKFKLKHYFVIRYLPLLTIWNTVGFKDVVVTKSNFIYIYIYIYIYILYILKNYIMCA